MECFTCAGCDIRLDKIGYIEENDQPYCNKCYELSCAYPCAKCGKKIVGVSSKWFAQEVTNQIFDTSAKDFRVKFSNFI